VCDDQVLAFGGGAFDDIERGHHGDGNAGYFFVWVAGFEGVHRRSLPRHADMLLNTVDDLLGGWLLGQARACRG
jgi:hypothetical protein